MIVLARGSRLVDIHREGLVVAARGLAGVGDVARFADREPGRVLNRDCAHRRVLQ